MGQPVKISDELLLEARQVSAVMNRSIAGQIEFWARLGQAIEPVLSGSQTLALARGNKEEPLSKVFASVNTPEGEHRFLEHLRTQPFPHFEATSKNGIFIKIDRDGARELGRFVRRKFQPLVAKKTSRSHV